MWYDENILLWHRTDHSSSYQCQAALSSHTFTKYTDKNVSKQMKQDQQVTEKQNFALGCTLENSEPGCILMVNWIVCVTNYI